MGEFKLKARQFDHLVKKYRKVPPVILGGDLSEKTSFASNQRILQINSGLDSYTGAFGKAQLIHLLKRTLIGISKPKIDAFAGQPLDAVLDQILRYDPNPDPPINNYNGIVDTPDPDVVAGESWVLAPYNVDYEGPRTVSLKAWHIRNILNQPPTIHEKMIFFWHNLLPVKMFDVFVGKMNYTYLQMLRENALGNYRTMIRKLTLDPAMLMFLNGASNNAEAPDENYARELQELFCIGKGLNANFTEGDVREAAKVLTGWTIAWNTVGGSGKPLSYFEPDLHDFSDKQFSAFYGNTVIPGTGAQELDQLLDMIFENQETAYYLARRLYNFFVYSDISAAAEANVIGPLAGLIRDNNYDILPAVRALLSSEHFYEAELMGASIKNPLDYLIGLWKAFGMPVENYGVEAFNQQTSMLWHMAELGLEIGDPPSVAGWPAYYQKPQYDKSWITTDSIVSRAQMGDSMIFWGFWIDENTREMADLIGFLEMLDDPGNPNAMIQEVSEQLLGITPSDNQITDIKSILLSGQENDYYWTSAWDNFQQDKGNQQLRAIVMTRLRPAIQRIMHLGENHLI